jgi:hypothetical protein
MAIVSGSQTLYVEAVRQHNFARFYLEYLLDWNDLVKIGVAVPRTVLVLRHRLAMHRREIEDSINIHSVSSSRKGLFDWESRLSGQRSVSEVPPQNLQQKFI